MLIKRAGRAARAVLVLFVPGLLVAPFWCGREASRWYSDDIGLQSSLARHIADWVQGGVDTSDFSTGHSLFNGEWAFGTYQMAALGFAQVMLEHPETRDEFTPSMEKCVERILDADIAEFDRRSWGEGALSALEKGGDHAAYLGYLNLVLGMHRRVAPSSRFSELNDRITASFVRRLEVSPIGLLETYPGERYPVDNCAVLGSIALHAKASGIAPPDVLGKTLNLWRERYVDGKTGLFFQAVDSKGRPIDQPRASGTALGLYMLSLGDVDLARDLYQSLRNTCETSFLGFGLMREYPRGVPGGSGDIDSGPVVLGIGFSATGFTIAGSRAFSDPEAYSGLYRTAHLVGSPLSWDGRRNYVCGGPLGNAILFAMLTAQPVGGGR